LENLPSPKQDEIVLPFDSQIVENYVFECNVETKKWESGFNLENTTDEIFHAQLVNEDLQGKLINHVFTYPIENYMEVLFRSSVQSCFHDQIQQQLPLHSTTLILWKKNSSPPFDCANKQSRGPLVSAAT